jgi:uncharacterized protein YbaP (TraB family)
MKKLRRVIVGSMPCIRTRMEGVAAVLLFAALAVGIAARPAKCQEKTSLWKVTANGHTAYLMGSIHLLSERDYPLDERMEKAFEESDVVVFEIHPDSLESPAAQAYVLQNAVYGGGRTLESEMGDSVYAGASALAESLGIDLKTMNPFKPWFVAMTLQVAEMQRMGFDPMLGIDMYFAKKAAAERKAVLGLETVQYQLGLFTSLTDAQQRDYLIQTLAELSDTEKELPEILAAWRGGKLDEIEKTMNKRFTEFPEIFDRLVTRRNVNWVGEIDRYLAGEKIVLVVVGVGHMPGEAGLVELLRKRGYTVEQQ